VLVARAAGQAFEDVLRTRLFEPLGMRDTAFWTSQTDRLATGYLPTAEGLSVWDEPDGRWKARGGLGRGSSTICPGVSARRYTTPARLDGTAASDRLGL
jgi:CubicO group peptidase (beta-lactamase class C family)